MKEVKEEKREMVGNVETTLQVDNCLIELSQVEIDLIFSILLEKRDKLNPSTQQVMIDQIDQINLKLLS